MVNKSTLCIAVLEHIPRLFGFLVCCNWASLCFVMMSYRFAPIWDIHVCTELSRFPVRCSRSSFHTNRSFSFDFRSDTGTGTITVGLMIVIPSLKDQIKYHILGKKNILLFTFGTSIWYWKNSIHIFSHHMCIQVTGLQMTGKGSF